ncbi:MAG: helix-turn-helix domain-containing protein [bacterium]|nr:helix-turn-helix domain-containing protein [bacterium]
MELTEVLEKTGLNEKEARVYLALLELGTAPVQSIASKASIKRPTTYLILHDLQRKGLVSIVPRAKKALYQAESPETLISDLNKKQELMKRFLPNLQAIFNARKEKPQVQLFEGRGAVGQVYDKIFESSEILFFSTIGEVFQLYPDMPDQLRKKIKAGKLKVREILTRTKADLEYVSQMEQSEAYQSRFTPKDIQEFLSDSAIYGESVAFFSFSPLIFAVVITSKQIVESIRTLYEIAWQASEPLGLQNP